MNYRDQSEEGAEVVRSFMLTRGRTRATAKELPLETLVSAPRAANVNMGKLPPEQRRIVELVATPASLAEVSALLDLPLRTVIVMGSEMVAAGTLVAESTVEVVDTSFLTKIRSAFQSL